MNPPPEDSQLGLHLPDEPCYFPVALRWESCPCCGANVQINRLGAFAFQVIFLNDPPHPKYERGTGKFLGYK